GAAGHRRHRRRARGRRPRHGAGPDARRARARGDGVACARRRVREGGELRGRPAGVRAGARAGRRARATAADRARPLRSRPAPAPARPLSDAEDHLARAVVLFADMGMRAWLETSQPELKALGHLVIVARTNVDLFHYLTDKFAGDPGIRFI